MRKKADYFNHPPIYFVAQPLIVPFTDSLNSTHHLASRMLDIQGFAEGFGAPLFPCHTFLFVSRAASGRPHESTSFFMFRHKIPQQPLLTKTF
jgi:hypothetical protein